MNVVHEIKNGRTTQSSLNGLDQLSRHLHILDEFVAILIARLPHTIHINDGMDECVQHHNARCNRCWYPIVWWYVIIWTRLRTCGHYNHVARSNETKWKLRMKWIRVFGFIQWMFIYLPLTNGMCTCTFIARRNAYTEYMKTAENQCHGHG